MSTVLKKRAVLLACVPALLGLACGLGPGIAAAAEAPDAATAATPLTSDLATLAEPAVAAAPQAPQAEAMALPLEGPGSLVREGGDVVVEAHFEDGAVNGVGALEAAGATVLAASARYQTVALSVAPEDLAALAEVPGLEAVAPSYEPVFYGVEEEAGAPATSVASNGLCEGGSVISQAMTQLRVAAARGAFGARGAGQTIGVISDTFNTGTEAIGGGPIATVAAGDEVTNDLPGPESTCSGQQVPVNVIAEGPAGGTDEGRAMLQVIHDLAPHAQLAFATAYSTEVQFAEHIEKLAAPVAAGGAGADVIVDDVSYLSEPFFQDGAVALAIKKVTEAGVTYLTAAGNDNLIRNGHEFASWQRSVYQDAKCPSKVAALLVSSPLSSESCLNFASGGSPDTTFGITVQGNAELSIDLQWAEPWYGVESDLNAYLLNAAGAVLVGPRFKNVGSGALPVPLELLSWKNPVATETKVQLVIDRCIGNCNTAANIAATPLLKFILVENGGGVSETEYPESEGPEITVGPTIYGHAGSTSAITLAAANYEQSPTAPSQPEVYSSRGPVTHYFGPVTSTSPAPAIGTETIAKPNLTATDCASTTFFATLGSDGWHFCGTSEAAPHAAAVVALMRQTRPPATPGAILAALESSATPFTTVKKHTAVGAGLVNAEAAITKIGGVAVNDPASTVVAAHREMTTAPPAPPPTGSVVPSPRKKPKARIVAHPKALERTRKSSIVGRFRFAADESGVTFSCQVDKAARRVCGRRFHRRFGIGRHVLKVRAVDSADGSSSAPVTFRFRVQRVGP